MNLSWIKKVYLYLVSLVSLIILIIAGVMLIQMALKAWVFTKADEAYYYPPTRMDCASLTEDIRKTSPECTDPNFLENEKQREEARRQAQRHNDAANAIAMILVASPVFYYHWKLARRES